MFTVEIAIERGMHESLHCKQKFSDSICLECKLTHFLHVNLGVINGKNNSTNIQSKIFYYALSAGNRFISIHKCILVSGDGFQIIPSLCFVQSYCSSSLAILMGCSSNRVALYLNV